MSRGGKLHAGDSLDVLPLHVAAVADLVVEDHMVSLFVGVRFPAPLPFANSGLGLFGLAGRFVSNGTRSVDRGIPDVVAREQDVRAGRQLAEHRDCRARVPQP